MSIDGRNPVSLDAPGDAFLAFQAALLPYLAANLGGADTNQDLFNPIASIFYIDPRRAPYNAKFDVCTFTNGVIASNNLSKLTLGYDVAQASAYTVGNCIRLAGMGAGGVDLVTTIAAWDKPTRTITLGAPASGPTTTVSGEFGTDDAPAINAALSAAGFSSAYSSTGAKPTVPKFAPGSGGFWQFGRKRVVLRPIADANSGIGISSPIRILSGSHLSFEPGASLMPLGNFAGEAAIYQHVDGNNVSKEIFGATIDNPFVVANQNCDRGIWLSRANSCSITGDVRVYGARKRGLKIGPDAQSDQYDRAICNVVTGSIYIYNNAYTSGIYHANDDDSVGMEFTRYAYDNTVNDLLHVQGYRTGYWDRGANNKLPVGLHAWTGKNQGKMTRAARLDGGDFSVGRIFVDSPFGEPGEEVYGVDISKQGKIGEVASTVNTSVGTLDNTVVLVRSTYAGVEKVEVGTVFCNAPASAKFKQIVQDTGGRLTVGLISSNGNHYSIGYTTPDEANAAAVANLAASSSAGIAAINAQLPGADWTPDQIAGQLAAWFDATQGVVVSGSDVTQWADRAAGITATVAANSTAPEYLVSGWDGTRPCLRFDGQVGGDMLRLGSKVPLSTATDVSIFTVAKRRTQNVVETGRCDLFALLFGASTARIMAEVAFYPVSVDATQRKIRLNTAGGNAYDLALTAPTNGQIISSFFTQSLVPEGKTAVGVSGSVYFDNTSVDPSSGVALNFEANASYSYIGGAEYGSAPTTRRAAMDLAEIIVVTGAISNDLRRKIEGYLARKWFGAVTAVLPSAHKYGAIAPKNPAALTSYIGIETPIFSLIGANFNSTADQQMLLRSDLVGQFSSYHITKVRVIGKSGSLASAVGGLYTAASKAGLQVVASGQGYAEITAAGKGKELTISPDGLGTFGSQSAPFLSLSTAQGAAATADIYVYGMPLS